MTQPQTEKESRVGKQPVQVPKGVTVTIAGLKVTAKGGKGEISREFRPEISIAQKGDEIIISLVPGAPNAIMFQGTTRALIQNMVQGVSEGYKRSLDFRGVGYRAEVKDGKLKMTVGLSHQPELKVPATVSVKIETIDIAGTKFPRVLLESVDKELVGQFAARIRSIRPPEPYKGKGVRYTGEKIREKAGKSGK